MDKKLVINGETYRLKFFINGWEEGEGYFREIGRFGKASMDRMAAGEIIERDGNRFHICYEDTDGHRYVVNNICVGSV